MAEKIIVGCVLVWLVLMGCTPAYAGKWPTDTYQCIANDKLSRYPEKGSAPRAITLSALPALCPGGGAIVSCAGGHDCDNELHPVPSGCYYCRVDETCIREWDNRLAPYSWVISGGAELDASWSNNGTLNDGAYVRADPRMIYEPRKYFIKITRSECTFAPGEVSNNTIIQNFEGVVNPPPVLRRSVWVHFSLGVNKDIVDAHFEDAGLILRTDNDKRPRVSQPWEWLGSLDHSQCVEFVVGTFVEDDAPVPPPILDTRAKLSAALSGATKNVTYVEMGGPYAGYGQCPGRKVLIKYNGGDPSATLVHEWGHNGNIHHPNEVNDSGISNWLYDNHPHLFDNEIMTGPRNGKWINQQYHKCDDNKSITLWPRLPSSEL